MSTPVGVIKKFVKTLMETKKTGYDAIDEAFKAVGAVRYDVFKQKFAEDTKNYNYQTFAEQGCGILLNNEDTGAITGSDAGGKTTKTAESIVPETAKAVKLTDAEYNSFTKNGLTVNVTYAEKDDKNVDEKFNYSGATYLEKQKLVTRALYNWWIPESLDIINKSLGINFTDGRANINKINVIFFSSGDSDSFRYNRQDEIRLGFNYDMGLASEVDLYINADFLYNMTADDKNGVLEGGDKLIYSDLYGSGVYKESAKFTNYLDRLILQAMAEITFKANVPYTNYTTEIGTGLVELVGGYDSASTSYSNFINPNESFHSGYRGYGYMRYLAKNYSDGVPDGVSYNAKKTVLTLTTDYTDDTLDLADFESTVKTVNAKALKTGITIIGNKLDNSIVGGSGNDSILGGDGKDTLSGGKGDDTLKGGKDDDVFIYTAGNDVINDYATGDKISLGGAIANTKLSGDDVVFTIGKGTLTVKDGANKKLSMINSKGKTFETLVSGATTLTINNKTKSPVRLDANVGTADASKRTAAVKIVGNKLDNIILGDSKNDILYGESGNDSILGNAGNDKIYGGLGSDTLKGGKGNDTLVGGAGNDSLWGDAGSDVFIYNAGEGNDIIYGFDNKDTLTLDSLDFTATYKDKAVTLTFEEGSVTLKNFTATTFHINDETYKISGSKFVQK